ncbi:hypothetical protein GGS24DRAFT_443666 [Hypoxylon argillaceum]|nr:hypothetical protein GGS24DRAFT_443666 [Hypoxylon argillaceum]
MAFEQPDPRLYPPPASLQPKRPVATEAVASGDETTMVGKIGTAPSTARTPEAPAASSKPMPASVPASAMRTGPVPLSQTQKRTLTTNTTAAATTTPEQQPQKGGAHDSSQVKPNAKPVGTEPAALQPTTPQDVKAQTEQDRNGFPTLQLRLPGHPATWPEEEPQYPRSRFLDEEED